MAQDRRYADDDGRMVADMSGVRSALPEPSAWAGSTAPSPDAADGRGAAFASPHRPVTEELAGPEEQAAVILGTLKAALSIGMVYVIGFGIAIALMLWLWT